MPFFENKHAIKQEKRSLIPSETRFRFRYFLPIGREKHTVPAFFLQDYPLYLSLHACTESRRAAATTTTAVVDKKKSCSAIYLQKKAGALVLLSASVSKTRPLSPVPRKFLLRLCEPTCGGGGRNRRRRRHGRTDGEFVKPTSKAAVFSSS